MTPAPSIMNGAGQGLPLTGGMAPPVTTGLNPQQPTQQPPQAGNPIDVAAATFRGVDPWLVNYYKYSNPPEYAKTIADFNKAIMANVPEALRLADAAGIPRQDAASQALRKAVGVPLLHTRDSVFVDPFSGKYVSSVPHEGRQIVQDDNGGFQILRTPGANAAEAQSAASQGYGQFVSKPVPTYNAQGQATFSNPASVMPPPAILNLPPSGSAQPGNLGSAPPAGGGSGGGVFAAPPPGAGEYGGALGSEAAKRAGNLRSSAAESPMRVNVLDNIINLSKSGVQTGPTSEWTNAVKGYAASVPGLSSVLPGLANDAARFQEIQKFMYQNALRNWSAAGGSQTDSQLEAQSHANPNDKLFPQAVQHVAQWGKAGELAIQAKANAQDAYLQAHGNTPQAQAAFEAQWRQNFRPNDYIKQTVDPVSSDGWVLHQNPRTGELKYFNPSDTSFKNGRGIW
jgi:hypothetical protein